MIIKQKTYYSNTPESQLLALSAAGDADAFEILYRRYRDKSYAMLLSFVKSHADAEDLLQDIFVKLWIGRKNLERVEDFDAYLFITLRHALSYALRKEEQQEKLKIRAGGFEHLPRATAEEQVHIRDIETLVSSALEQLPASQRRIYLMSRREGLTHEQIAAELGLSPKTISNTITLILNHIRNFLRQYGYLVMLAWSLSCCQLSHPEILQVI